jgi:hypothetical protein
MLSLVCNKTTFFCRVLKTPTEEIWPGVSKLPEYKATFPKCIHNNLTSHAKNIEEDGLDLLQVLVQVAFCGHFKLLECTVITVVPPYPLNQYPRFHLSAVYHDPKKNIGKLKNKCL